MKRALLLPLVAIASASLVPGSSVALVDTFSGVATIDLHERLVHGHSYDLDTSVVEVEMTLNNVGTTVASSPATGTALVRRGSAEETVAVQGWMSPPRGGGGNVWVEGASAAGDLYCFVIGDRSDAPEGTTKTDVVYAAFEPAQRFGEGHVADMTADPPRAGPIPTAMCGDLLYLSAPVRSGDFTFASIV